MPEVGLTLSDSQILRFLLRSLSSRTTYLRPAVLSLTKGCPVLLLGNSIVNEVQIHLICSIILDQPDFVNSRYQEGHRGGFLRLKQLPMKIALAITIDNSQGLIFSRVGELLDILHGP